MLLLPTGPCGPIHPQYVWTVHVLPKLHKGLPAV